MIDPEPPSDLAALRRRLAGQTGRALWRTLDEVVDRPEFLALLREHAPRHAAAVEAAVDRRLFLKLMGASLALAGLGACTQQPTELIVPYVEQPERLVPGEPLHFATAMPLAGTGIGLLVESHEGRPTKVEGNPEHPASLGATDVFAQASVLGLYDPDRSQVLTRAGDIRPWRELLGAVQEALGVQRARRGAGLRLLTGAVTSPTLAGQIRELLAALPEARWHRWEPVSCDAARRGSRLAFGEVVDARHHLERAAVVLSLDADLLGSGPAWVRHARDFARGRRPEGAMSRLYVAESTPSVTGSAADHRLPVRATDVEALARAVAARLGVRLARPAPAPATETARRWVEAAARDLERHRGAALVVAGDQQPAGVHALAHAMNQALGAAGRTVVYTEPVEADPVEHLASLRELVADMAAGGVELLVVAGTNPVFTAPADLGFAEAMARVPLRVHLGLHEDETGVLCHWHVPEAHYLESWSDVRAFDGTVSIVQPLIAPLYQGRTAHELLAALGERPERTSHDIVREHWRRERPEGDFEAFWRRALHDGVVPGTAAPPRAVSLRPGWDAGGEGPAPGGGLEVVFRPDPHVHDGRFANNGWLQELPKPVTKLTWDNAALLAPATAARLGLRDEDAVELRLRGRRVRAPVRVVPGHAEESVTLHLGYGRRRGGRVADGAGFDAYALRTADAPAIARGLELRRTGERWPLAATQGHHRLEGRPVVRFASLAEYRADPRFAHRDDPHPEPPPSLYPDHPYPGHAWGMAIDLGACIGCNACALACQAENNVPVVGKDQVARGREMHWLRIDRYHVGPPEAPEAYEQPMLCMHCEKAPCEVVCPVNATVHSSEGLNEMVYNRCVGTRYCSNNCPYKVRRFNFYNYTGSASETLKMAMNPEVTVRSRGVMEKCTYCVQRIEAARARAILEGRPIRDGDVVTACQQACPSEAIVFGDLNDPTSRVARLHADPRSYAVLGELNTRPRTAYLAAVRNPSPALEPPGGAG